MSEEKLYAVKNDEGKWADGGDYFGNYAWATPDKDECERDAKQKGGHVVTLIEEPEKVTVSPNEAKAIESLLNADTYAGISDPFKHLFTSRYKEDIKRLIKAIKNGYTVAKEKKYLVYKALGGKQKHELFAQAYRPALFPDTITWFVGQRKAHNTGASAQFTEAEIEHYGLQDCEKEEVTDDGND
ncbi:DUF1642 domain-containing protein [Lacticaseibacillus paracasei]|uniref:DUF1642 domain-containing protein n=1 Tax=Lacticaseibacillus paracasei TaxID=1597 RepID=UPI002875E230|nr:DUF1642 domain-containing protein [Lacticaseibacillus paracasei]MDS0491414.1 DUF1642 domain-containing protein [Lacticaseibacillus paracasei]